MRRLRTLVTLLVAGSWSVVAAQQPLTSPIYYLSSAPRLEVGAPVTGVLTEASGRNFKDGTYLDVLTLRGEAGERIDLYASSDAFDTYLSLYAPDGSLLDYNDDDAFGGTTDSAIRGAALPETGTYVVVLSGYGPWDLGPYTVELVRSGSARHGETAIEVPTRYVGRLDVGSDGQLFRFELGETTALAIEARSEAFDTTLELVDEFGYVLAYNDDAPAEDYTTDSALVALVPPGSYYVLVQPYSPFDVGDGSFELEVRRLVPAP